MKWFDIKNKNYWRVSGNKDYTIQEVSQVSGITVRTLRNYLKTYEELLEPRRGYYNSLIFSERDVTVFVMIRTLIKDGFSKEDILEKIEAELLEMQNEQKKLEEAQPIETPSKLALKPKEENLPVESEEEDFEQNLPMNPVFLNHMNEYFLSLEKRNAMLENKLDHIEGMLCEMKESRRDGLLPRSFNLILDSTQAFWDALKKSIP